MSRQDLRNSEAAGYKSLLNAFLSARDGQVSLDQLPTFTGFQSSLSMAALMWMILEIDSYTSLLTSRECLSIKAWKTIVLDGEFDVYYRIAANGTSVSPFDLKTYVVFPNPGECRFILEDWANRSSGFANGRVVNSGATYKCERVPTQSRPPRPINYYSDDNVMV